MPPRAPLVLLLLAGLALAGAVFLVTLRSPAGPASSAARPPAGESRPFPPSTTSSPSPRGTLPAVRRPAGPYGAATLRGRVVTARARDPVPGHAVHLVASDLKNRRDTRTDGQGRYAFEEVPAGGWFLVCDTTGRFPIERNPSARRRVNIPGSAGEIVEDFVLVEGTLSAISGRVLAADGSHVERVRLDLYLTGKVLAQTLTVALDDAGAFFLPVEKPASHYRLQASAGGFLPATTPSTISVQQDITTLGITLVLVRPCRVEGRVVEPDGGPVANTSVFFLSGDPERPGIRRSRNFPTGEDGTFVATDLRPGPVTIRAFHKGYHRPPVLEMTLGQGETLDDVRIVLEPSDFVAGRVVDETGGGIPGAVVRVFGVTGATNADGFFRVSDDAAAHAGEVLEEVYTWAPGFVERTWPSIAVGREDNVFPLAHGATIQGTVSVEAPPRGLILRYRAIAQQGGAAREQTARLRGDRTEIPYAFQDLPPGTYRVEVSAEGYLTDPLGNLRIQGGETRAHADLILRLDPSGGRPHDG